MCGTERHEAGGDPQGGKHKTEMRGNQQRRQEPPWDGRRAREGAGHSGPVLPGEEVRGVLRPTIESTSMTVSGSLDNRYLSGEMDAAFLSGVRQELQMGHLSECLCC